MQLNRSVSPGGSLITKEENNLRVSGNEQGIGMYGSFLNLQESQWSIMMSEEKCNTHRCLNNGAL